MCHATPSQCHCHCHHGSARLPVATALAVAAGERWNIKRVGVPCGQCQPAKPAAAARDGGLPVSEEDVWELGSLFNFFFFGALDVYCRKESTGSLHFVSVNTCLRPLLVPPSRALNGEPLTPESLSFRSSFALL